VAEVSVAVREETFSVITKCPIRRLGVYVLQGWW